MNSSQRLELSPGTNGATINGEGGFVLFNKEDGVLLPSYGMELTTNDKGFLEFEGKEVMAYKKPDVAKASALEGSIFGIVLEVLGEHVKGHVLGMDFNLGETLGPANDLREGLEEQGKIVKLGGRGLRVDGMGAMLNVDPADRLKPNLAFYPKTPDDLKPGTPQPMPYWKKKRMESNDSRRKQKNESHQPTRMRMGGK